MRHDNNSLSEEAGMGFINLETHSGTGGTHFLESQGQISLAGLKQQGTASTHKLESRVEDKNYQKGGNMTEKRGHTLAAEQ